MLFLFNFFYFFHNNNGGIMKKFFLFFILFFVTDVHALSTVYISKRDIDTNEIVLDCDFILYDSNNNIVDSWIQDENVHISNVSFGFYKLVERPLIMGVFNDDLSNTYNLSISDDVHEFILYNQKIDVPDNLSYNYNFFGVFLIVVGLFCCKYKFI